MMLSNNHNLTAAFMIALSVSIAGVANGAVRHDILEFSARVLAPQRTQFHPID